jgi:hypothetical protein
VWTGRIRSPSCRSWNALSREQLGSSGTCVNVRLPSFPDDTAESISSSTVTTIGVNRVISLRSLYLSKVTKPTSPSTRNITTGHCPYRVEQSLSSYCVPDSKGRMTCTESHLSGSSLRSTSLWPRETGQDRQRTVLAISASSGISAWGSSRVAFRRGLPDSGHIVLCSFYAFCVGKLLYMDVARVRVVSQQ